MSDIQRYAGSTPSSSSARPAGILTRYQIRKEVDRVSAAKEVFLVEAEKTAIVQQVEAELIRQRAHQDVMVQQQLMELVQRLIAGYVRGAGEINQAAVDAVRDNPYAAEAVAQAEQHAQKLFNDHVAKTVAELDPRNYRRS